MLALLSLIYRRGSDLRKFDTTWPEIFLKSTAWNLAKQPESTWQLAIDFQLFISKFSFFSDLLVVHSDVKKSRRYKAKVRLRKAKAKVVGAKAKDDNA